MRTSGGIHIGGSFCEHKGDALWQLPALEDLAFRRLFFDWHEDLGPDRCAAPHSGAPAPGRCKGRKDPLSTRNAKKSE